MASSLSGFTDKVGLTCQAEVQLARCLHNETNGETNADAKKDKIYTRLKVAQAERMVLPPCREVEHATTICVS